MIRVHRSDCHHLKQINPIHQHRLRWDIHLCHVTCQVLLKVNLVDQPKALYSLLDSLEQWNLMPVYLAKCKEPLNIRWSRQLPKECDPSSVTVRLHPSGRWHISIRFDDLTIQPLPANDNAIGLDLGINSLMATSDGAKVTNPKQFKKHYRRLRLAQKELARKQKGSKNREKARRKVAKIHLKISDSRKDFLHKLTTQLVRENQTIAVETLMVS